MRLGGQYIGERGNMGQNKQNPLSLFILITGVIILFQFAPLLTLVQPIGFNGLGILSREMVQATMVVILALSLSLVFLALLFLLPGLLPNLDRWRLRLLPLAIGIVLVILGLASINLSGSVVSGTSKSIVAVGVELFSLGMISIALFVDRRALFA
jgi:hypothetical protein